MTLDAHLEQLGQRHNELDQQISREVTRPSYDQFTVKQLKRRKLRLKEHIEHLKRSEISS